MITAYKTFCRRSEGLRLKPYTCPAGFLSVGYGFNLDSGITPEIAEYLLDYKIVQAERFLINYLPCYEQLNDARRMVCMDMTYNLGQRGFLQFKKMIAAMERGDWQTAAAEIMDSKAARQLPGRYYTLSTSMATGSWSG